MKIIKMLQMEGHEEGVADEGPRRLLMKVRVR
jgi:hypothetical protein